MSLNGRLVEDVLLTGWGHNRSCTPMAETLESLTVHVVTETIGFAGSLGVQSLTPEPCGFRQQHATACRRLGRTYSNDR